MQEGIIVEKSPLTPLCQRGASFLALEKGREERFDYGLIIGLQSRYSNS